VLQVTGFELPTEFPSYGEDLKEFLLSAPKVQLDPANFDECLPKIREALGPTDFQLKLLKGQSQLIQDIESHKKGLRYTYTYVTITELTVDLNMSNLEDFVIALGL
jgi:hypothetical protein